MIVTSCVQKLRLIYRYDNGEEWWQIFKVHLMFEYMKNVKNFKSESYLEHDRNEKVFSFLLFVPTSRR